jgi:hypothetical protein
MRVIWACLAAVVCLAVTACASFLADRLYEHTEHYNCVERCKKRYVIAPANCVEECDQKYGRPQKGVAP